MDVLELYCGAVDAWTERVRAVPPDCWEAPTPCAEWNVRELVNHVVGEDLWTAPLMGGGTIAEVGDRFDGDLLGDDAQGAALSAADEAVASVTSILPGGGTVALSYGEEQMEEYVMQLAADHLVHGWDLAVATNGARELPASLVAGLAAWFADREELYRGAGMIGARQQGGSDPQSALLAGFGRDPAWGGDHA